MTQPDDQIPVPGFEATLSEAQGTLRAVPRKLRLRPRRRRAFWRRFLWPDKPLAALIGARVPFAEVKTSAQQERREAVARLDRQAARLRRRLRRIRLGIWLRRNAATIFLLIFLAILAAAAATVWVWRNELLAWAISLLPADPAAARAAAQPGVAPP